MNPDHPEPLRRGIRGVFSDAWRLARPYFMQSDERWSARLLLAAIIAMSLAAVGGDVLLNFWRRAFYDALQNKDYDAFSDLLLAGRRTEDGFMLGFVPIVSFLVPLGIATVYLTSLLQVRWRRWATQRLTDRWMSDRAYYTISLDALARFPHGTHGTDNPDQRIAEDLNSFTFDTPRLGLDLLSNIVSLVSFSGILWSLSGDLDLFGVQIPGYLFWLALLYCAAGTLLTHLAGRRYAALQFAKQRFEADFRFGLVRVRENAEGVALYAGEQPERANLAQRFGVIYGTIRAIMRNQLGISAVANTYSQAAVIFPFLIAAPRFFRGPLSFGGLMQIIGAFSSVQTAMSWLVTNYTDTATWRANVDRLTSFEAALDTAHALADQGVRLAGSADTGLRLDGVTIALPDGRVLLDQAGLVLPAGQATVLSGPSGTGKSTLFRAIAGIWPFGAGTVQRPAGISLFLPQRPYIPLGTLRHAVTYPAPDGTLDDHAIVEALTAAGLPALAHDLDADQPWGQRLSGGEQQRLAIARALLLRPDWLFLDEATASLDPAAEADLYRLLRERLPATTILSIAHRPEVSKWHDATLNYEHGALIQN